MTERKKELPSISLEQFIDFVEQCQEAYRLSYSSVGGGMRIRAFRIIFMRWNLRTINTICTMRP